MKSSILSDRVHSIAFNLTLYLTLSISLISAIAIVINYRQASREINIKLEHKIEEYVAFLEKSLELPLFNFDIQSIRHNGEFFSHIESIVNLTVNDSYSEIIYEYNNKEIDTSALKVDRKVFYRSKLVGMIQLSMTDRFYAEINNRLLWQSIITMLITILSLIFLTGFFLRFFLKKPFLHLNEIIGSYARGENEINAKEMLTLEFRPIVAVLQNMSNTINRSILEIQQAEEKYRGIFHNAVEGMFQITLEGLMISANSSMARILGYQSSEQLISAGIDISSEVSTDPDIKTRLEELLEQDGLVSEMETQFTRKDKSRFWGSLSLRNVIDENGKLICLQGSLLDISERKEKETAQRGMEAAQAASKAKSEFLANMSHELRTPLNAITGFSELLSSMAADTKQKSYLTAIKTAGKNLLTLINDILDLSKIEAGKIDLMPRPMNIRSVINEIDQIFKLKMEVKNIEFLSEIDVNVPSSLILDETKLRQILFNLVGNAVKFTDKGHITIAIKNLSGTGNYERVDLGISVEDSGVGINENELESIFDSFQQQEGQDSGKYGGTGLGLTISKRLIEMMNGNISVTSRKGHGTTFSFVLRKVEISLTEATVVDETHFDLESVSFEKAKILVVDDIESNREVIKEILIRMNLEVIIAENGQEAVLLAREYQPDVTLMDIRMPIMDGVEATRQIKSDPLTCDLPVIALTASQRCEEKSKMESYGLNGFMTKPVKISVLVKELSNYLKISQIKSRESATGPDEKVEDVPSIESIEQLPELLDILNNGLIEEADSLKSVLRISDIHTFVNKVEQLGKEYNSTLLTNYATKLKEFAQSFDITNIEISLSRFPKLVQELADILDQHNK